MRSVVALIALIALIVLGLPLSALAADELAPPWQGQLDQTTLTEALKARGFEPNPELKIVVVEAVSSPKEGESSESKLSFRWFDHRGTSLERDTWWPASSIKLYAAIAALERVNAMGFGPRANVTFHYERGDVTQSVRNLIRRALIPSNNVAFDRLVEIVGFDRLNKKFFAPAKGFWSTVLNRGYSGRMRDEETGRGTHRYSSRITISKGKRSKELPARVGKGTYDCPEHGNCTPLIELAEAMRRVAFHESLPEAQRFKLSKRTLNELKRAIGKRKPRGNGVVDGLRAGFGEEHPIEVMHKPGYANKWFSDVVYVKSKVDGSQWVVAVANHPGREACDEAAKHVGAILAEGGLNKAPKPKAAPEPKAAAEPAKASPPKPVPPATDD